MLNPMIPITVGGGGSIPRIGAAAHTATRLRIPHPDFIPYSVAKSTAGPTRASVPKRSLRMIAKTDQWLNEKLSPVVRTTSFCFVPSCGFET